MKTMSIEEVNKMQKENVWLKKKLAWTEKFAGRLAKDLGCKLNYKQEIAKCDKTLAEIEKFKKGE